ncbi:MAG: hypothetical protein AAFR55_03360, partial [Pseudomonadota bacterium]
VTTAHALDERICALFTGLELNDDLYAYGLNTRIRPDTSATDLERIVDARREFRRRLVAAGRDNLLTPFAFDRFNDQATLGENLRFGVVSRERQPTLEGRAANPFVSAILAAEALELPLAEIGAGIAETSVELFAELPAGHALFDRFSMVKAADLEIYTAIVQDVARLGLEQLPQPGRNRLIALAFDYIEPRHRLGLVTDDLKARILRARRSIVRYLPQEYAGDIEFYDPDRVTMAAPLRDNLLFGRISQNIANADRSVTDMLTELLRELDLDRIIYAHGLDFDVGPRGSALFAQQRAAIAIARALVRQPSILVLEDALRAYPTARRHHVMAAIRAAMVDGTVIASLEDDDALESFDGLVTFDGPRPTVERAPVGAPRSGAGDHAALGTNGGPGTPDGATDAAVDDGAYAVPPERVTGETEPSPGGHMRAEPLERQS